MLLGAEHMATRSCGTSGFQMRWLTDMRGIVSGALWAMIALASPASAAATEGVATLTNRTRSVGLPKKYEATSRAARSRSMRTAPPSGGATASVTKRNDAMPNLEPIDPISRTELPRATLVPPWRTSAICCASSSSLCSSAARFGRFRRAWRNSAKASQDGVSPLAQISRAALLARGLLNLFSIRTTTGGTDECPSSRTTSKPDSERIIT